VLAAVARLDLPSVAMEACGSAHDLARRLCAQSRAVRLLVPADVRAFVRGQKNDYNDAPGDRGGRAEAAPRPKRTANRNGNEQGQVLH